MLAVAPTFAASPDRLIGHGGPVKSVTLSADGRQALTASFDYSVILWRLEGQDGAVVKRLIGHDAAVNDAAFIPGTMRAVSVSDDGTIIVWNLDAGHVVKRFEGTGDKAIDIAVSADGRYAAAAAWNDLVRLFDLKELEELPPLTGHRGRVNSVAFSDDGSHVYSASYDGTVRKWVVAEGRFETTVVSHGWGVNVVRVLPGDLHVLIGAVDGSAAVVFADTGETIVDLPSHEAPILAATVDTDAGLAATGSADGKIQVYAIAGWTRVAEIEGGYGPVWGLAFADGGRRLFHVGLDDYAIAFQVEPRKSFDPVLSTYPRRFQASGDIDPGELQFQRKCSVCHTLTPDDANRAGPTLHGVFGRRAGTLAGYPYSKALLDSDIVWNAETIGRLFDDGPDVVTPGTKMPVQRIKAPEDLLALIAFLKRATTPDPATAN